MPGLQCLKFIHETSTKRKKNCHSSKLHQKFHTLWMMCLLESFHQMEIFLSWYLNGVLMEIENRLRKHQNHNVIKSKAIDLFWMNSIFLSKLRISVWLSNLFAEKFNSSRDKNSDSTKDHGWFNTSPFCNPAWWYLHNLVSFPGNFHVAQHFLF